MKSLTDREKHALCLVAENGSLEQFTRFRGMDKHVVNIVQMKIEEGLFEKFTSWNPRTVLEELTKCRGVIEDYQWDGDLSKNILILHTKSLMPPTPRTQRRAGTCPWWNSKDKLIIKLQTKCYFDQIKSWTPERAELSVVIEYSGNGYIKNTSTYTKDCFPKRKISLPTGVYLAQAMGDLSQLPENSKIMLALVRAFRFVKRHRRCREIKEEEDDTGGPTYCGNISKSDCCPHCHINREMPILNK